MTFITLISAAVILLCVLFNRLSDKIGIPMLLAFILLGMAFGTDGIFKIPFENYGLAEQVCSVALIFIMFYGGFGTNWYEARPVAAKSVLLSTAGVVATAALTGLFCRFVLRFPWLESLLVGSVISSTDAASVFAILRSKKMGLKDHTASLLEIESGSNDPCSYMLTVIVLSLMRGDAGAGSILWMVVAQFAFGIVVGVLTAFGAAKILGRVHFETAGFDMVFMIGAALLSYSAASLAGGNGYLSAYLSGIILGNKKIPNKKSLVHFFDGVTGLMQMLIFFLLGLLSTPSRIPLVFPAALGVALFLTFVARPLAVFGILTPFRCGVRQQLLVSFSGLRGAASIVFAIMATVDPAYLSRDLFHIIFCIVLLSITFQGTLLSPCAKWLGMTDDDADVLRTFSDYSEEVDLKFIQLSMKAGNPWVGSAICDIPLPPDTLIVMILRGKENIIPDGKTILEENDIVVISARMFEDESRVALKEQIIGPKSKWIGKKIMDFSPESGELVIMILRGDETLVPKGDTVIRKHDVLVIHSAAGQGG